MSYKKSIGENLEAYVIDVDAVMGSGRVFELEASDTEEFELKGTGSVIVDNVTANDSAVYNAHKASDVLTLVKSYGASSLGASSGDQDVNLYVNAGKLTIQNSSASTVKVKISAYIL